MGLIGDVGGFFKGAAEGALGRRQGHGGGSRPSGTGRLQDHDRRPLSPVGLGCRGPRRQGGRRFRRDCRDRSGQGGRRGRAGRRPCLAHARGQGSAFVGKLFGEGAILVGTALIPGGAEADAAEGLGDAGRLADLAGDAGKVADAAADAGNTIRLCDAKAFKAAAEHTAPDTTYDFGTHSWTTDAWAAPSAPRARSS